VKKHFAIVAFCLSFVAGTALGYVRDWHDLDAVHKHITDAIHEMERARAANHYDMAGHGKRAEQFLRCRTRTGRSGPGGEGRAVR
jgi:hypothetical protein